MTRRASNMLSTALIGAGGLAWALAGPHLLADCALKAPLNPLGINGSPYGEVLAMAMQSPIETIFHAGMSGGTHQHEAGKECRDCDRPATPPLMSTKPSLTLGGRLANLLGYLDAAREARTNPKAPSEAHKRYLRRQAEDKLRFAYQLDPAHYGNYNSLHFFLTESAVGTHPELTPSAAKLAEETIQYCLRQNHDPRPALTAAAAATNMLQLMFNDRQKATPRFSTTQMRQCLNLLDHCLARYSSISQEWKQSNNWDRLSPQRITECEERCQFIGKIRDASEKTILRLQAGKQTPDSKAHNMIRSQSDSIRAAPSLRLNPKS